MKTLFVFRSSYESDYILSRLEQKNLLHGAILETGKAARFQKLKRLFRRTSIFKYPIIILDLLALLIYSAIMEGGVRHKLKAAGYRKEAVKLTINDANDATCIQFIQQYRPDIVFIYGTSILKGNFLKNVHATIVNIHSGIVPYYRNVHSDFWAYLKNDYKNIGISLILLDAGIDTGSVVFQKRIHVTQNTSLMDIKVKSLMIIPQLIEFTLQKYAAHKLSGKPQQQSAAGFYPTPSVKDVLKLLRKTVLEGK